MQIFSSHLPSVVPLKLGAPVSSTSGLASMSASGGFSAVFTELTATGPDHEPESMEKDGETKVSETVIEGEEAIDGQGSGEDTSDIPWTKTNFEHDERVLGLISDEQRHVGASTGSARQEFDLLSPGMPSDAFSGDTAIVSTAADAESSSAFQLLQPDVDRTSLKEFRSSVRGVDVPSQSRVSTPKPGPALQLAEVPAVADPSGIETATPERDVARVIAPVETHFAAVQPSSQPGRSERLGQGRSAVQAEPAPRTAETAALAAETQISRPKELVLPITGSRSNERDQSSQTNQAVTNITAIREPVSSSTLAMPTPSVSHGLNEPVASKSDSLGLLDGISAELDLSVSHRDANNTSHFRIDGGTLPTSASTFELTAATRPETVRNAAAQAVEILVRQPGKPVEISLNPEELGRVRMTLSTTETGVTVVISSERAETQDLMRRHIDQLAQEFQKLGYENTAFEFTDDSSGSPGDQRDGQDSESLDPVLREHPETARTYRLGSTGLDLRL